MQKKPQTRLIIGVISVLLIILTAFLGVYLFKNRRYNLISSMIAVFSALPFIVSFEKRNRASGELVIISVMSAISVMGRAVFAAVPGFKPVTAITVITGSCFGPEAGFMTGAVSAVASNIFFGQGPWTPFQMIVWGLIGYISGFVGKTRLFENKLFLSLFGVISGALFSLVMNFQTLLSVEGELSLSRFLAVNASSLPFTIIYALSNVVFLLALYNPFVKKLNRIKIKYGIGEIGG